MQIFETPEIQLIALNLTGDPITASNDLGFNPYGSDSGYNENTLKIIGID